MAYILSPRLNKKDKQKVLSAMRKLHRQNEKIENANKSIREFNSQQKYKKDYMKLQRHIPASKVLRNLKDKGLSYSTDNMYHDVRRTGATFNAKSTPARQRAAKWFDEYFEPMRVKKGVSSKKAYDIWQRAKTQSYEYMTETELQFALELRELGSPT